MAHCERKNNHSCKIKLLSSREARQKNRSPSLCGVGLGLGLGLGCGLWSQSKAVRLSSEIRLKTNFVYVKYINYIFKWLL